MFCEGRHVEKNKRRSKKYTVFFHLCFFVFSWKIDGKSWKKRENRVCAQKSIKNRARKHFFQQQFHFYLIFGDLLGCQGQLGTSRERSKKSIFHTYSQFRRKNSSDGPLEGSRQSPGLSQAPTEYNFKSIVSPILDIKKHVKNVTILRKTRQHTSVVVIGQPSRRLLGRPTNNDNNNNNSTNNNRGITHPN